MVLFWFFGRIVMIDDLVVLDVMKIKFKSLFLYIEFMFVCFMYDVDDI